MITLNDDQLTAIIKLCDGNPGAAKVCAQVLNHSKLGFLDLCHNMDDMGLQGAAIWVGFKNHCGEDLNRFVEALRTRDPAMVATIKKVVSQR